jgi:hypothetical protein
MFYEEWEINGILCFRTNPSSGWIPLTVEMIQQKKIRSLEIRVEEMQSIIDQCKLGLECVVEQGETSNFLEMILTLDRINAFASIKENG